ncbi:energy transducer TonB [Microbulbifer thermotolerans]|uniref:energy transducer TonB n=1 Tax=Microbulbifer thermotolerans TaxID=252514 RepID=UPI0022490B14|nr:energy transducer TonB [Microbulbifer thermotolerans]MCX2780096.1 energy transducer TonB [Microbulbifer thermotolerans]MCX2805520.1 energy transducer TonB [Microbulbifer thermotolerans]MCX2831953.1 energy transducer TonB [Microbulbifer thermotolerans]MCX2842482.1 energy transducer TonB [Microbulbifer thermotolerans]
MKLLKLMFALAVFAAGSNTASANDALDQYATQLKKHTAQHVRYPRRAQERKWEGVVQLQVTIDAKGQVQNIQVLKESNYSSLNRAALRSVESANPYPAIPAELGLDSYEFVVPINFKLSG